MSSRRFKEPVVLLPNPERLNFDAVREALRKREQQRIDTGENSLRFCGMKSLKILEEIRNVLEWYEIPMPSEISITQDKILELAWCINSFGVSPHHHTIHMDVFINKEHLAESSVVMTIIEGDKDVTYNAPYHTYEYTFELWQLFQFMRAL